MTDDGEQVRQARIERGLSQKKLAIATGVGERTIGRIERGEVKEPRELHRLQRYLNIGPYHQPEPAVPQLTVADALAQATAGELGLEVSRRLLEAERLLKQHDLLPSRGERRAADTLRKPGAVTLPDQALAGNAPEDANDDEQNPPEAGSNPIG